MYRHFFQLSIYFSFLFFSLLTLPNMVFANLSPVGYWETISDRTHQPASIVQIAEENGLLYGKVLKIYPQGGNKPTNRCVHCPGKLYNKPIEGLTIMWGLYPMDGERTGGHIMDPKTGKIYHCKLQLYDNGKYMKVRGYIGISLLGRTQTWIRVHST